MLKIMHNNLQALIHSNTVMVHTAKTSSGLVILNWMIRMRRHKQQPLGTMKFLHTTIPIPASIALPVISHKLFGKIQKIWASDWRAVPLVCMWLAVMILLEIISVNLHKMCSNHNKFESKMISNKLRHVCRPVWLLCFHTFLNYLGTFWSD